MDTMCFIGINAGLLVLLAASLITGRENQGRAQRDNLIKPRIRRALHKVYYLILDHFEWVSLRLIHHPRQQWRF